MCDNITNGLDVIKHGVMEDIHRRIKQHIKWETHDYYTSDSENNNVFSFIVKQDAEENGELQLKQEITDEFSQPVEATDETKTIDEEDGAVYHVLQPMIQGVEHSAILPDAGVLESFTLDTEEEHSPEVDVKSEPDDVKAEPDEKEHPHKCASCPETFSCIPDLAAHVRSEHANLYSFSRRGKKVINVKPRKDKKFHSCGDCDRTFRSQQHLSNHIKSLHDCDKSQLCKTCGQAFSKSHQVIEHMKAEHGVSKPYECSDCDSKFSEKKNLLRHEKSKHLGVKHDCRVCGRGFSDQSGVLRHERTVHRGVPRTANKSRKK